MRIQGFSFIFTAILCGFALSSSPVHAADPNGYTAQYECRAGNLNCDVDVDTLGNRICDQTIDPSTPWSAINWSNNTICLAAGDHTPKGTLTIPETFAGSPNNWKVLRAIDTSNEPWNQVDSARTKILRLEPKADYWLIHGITFPGYSGNVPGERIYAGSGAAIDHQIYDHILVEGTGPGSNFYGFASGSMTASNITFQNSVFRNVGPYQPLYEAIAISFEGGGFNRIVNIECYNWVSHCYQLGHDLQPTIPGLVVENSDIYHTDALYTDCNGNFTTLGPCMASESSPSHKVNGTEANPILVLNNRIWGSRQTDLRLCCNGTPGEGLAISNRDAPQDQYILVNNNVIVDNEFGIFAGTSLGRSKYLSIVGNIVYKHLDREAGQYGSYAVTFDKAQDSEFYLNTVVDAQKNFLFWADSVNDDLRCNVFIGAGSSDNAAGSNTIADWNVFYGTPSFPFGGNNDLSAGLSTRTSSTSYSTGTVVRLNPNADSCTGEGNVNCFLYKVTTAGTTAVSQPTYCAALGCTVQDGSAMLQAIRGPYVYKRKLLTVAGGETAVVPYARVHVSADEANLCPGAGPDRLGARTAVGINDDVAWTGILARDAAGATRDGTAGALQKEGNGGGESQTPYPGPNPAAVPGTIQTENFDEGGEGVAYHDNDAQNWGNAPDYRPTRVDIEADQGADNGHFVAVTVAGEWLEYTINVANAGSYTLEIPVASNGDGGTFHIEFDGANKTGAITAPNTGGWFTWQTLTHTVNLSAGTQVMRLALDTNGPTNSVANIDYIRLTPVAGGSTPYPGPNAAAIPGTVEAENFDNGGEGVAYHDNDAQNWGNAPDYRPTGVDIESDQGASNSHFVAVIVAGEWLQYTVNVATAGSYTLEVPVASNGDGGTFHIEFGGVDKTGAMVIPNTGGWFTWQTLTHTVNLSAGTQVMRIAMDSNGPTNAVGNIDFVRLVAGGGTGPTGSALREYILDLPDEVGFPDFNAGVTGSEPITSLEGPTDWADRYATRIRGYLFPPASGTYTFWLASDDDAELRLSSDDNPANVTVIASVSGWTDPRQWDKYTSQQSTAIQLQAGRRYYFEVVQREWYGGDNLAVGWQLPNGTFEGPIPGTRLSGP